MTKKKTKRTKKQSADIRYREYWRDNERFADLFNTVVFGGENVLHPARLSEKDTRVSRLIPVVDSERGIERTRDVMKTYEGTQYLLLGAENQTQVHYGMPLKSLTYDVLGYIDEANLLLKHRREEGGLTSAEFLSGMRKEDKLTPIVTIVIYYGEEPWDGPLSLSEMFDGDLAKFGLNQTEHRITLLQASESGQYHFQNKDNETIFSISRELFRGNMNEVKKQYHTQDLSQEIIAMIGCITGFKGMEQAARKGETNMCKAIDAIFEQERIKTEERMCKGIREALDKERRETEERMCKGIQASFDKVRRETEERVRKEQEEMLEQERIKTEERVRKEQEEMLEQERIRTEERVRKEQEEMLEQERIKIEKRMKCEEIEKLVKLLVEFKCEPKEIFRRLYENYNLSIEEAEVYLR